MSKLTAAKARAWREFSRYIRLRDCLETTGTTTHGKCCTCGALKEFGELQAGHFIDGRTNSVLFSDPGVHAQCYRCNVALHGNKVLYYAWMLAKYGQATIDALIAESKQAVKYSALTCRAIESHYKAKAKELEEHNENT